MVGAADLLADSPFVAYELLRQVWEQSPDQFQDIRRLYYDKDRDQETAKYHALAKLYRIWHEIADQHSQDRSCTKALISMTLGHVNDLHRWKQKVKDRRGHYLPENASSYTNISPAPGYYDDTLNDIFWFLFNLSLPVTDNDPKFTDPNPLLLLWSKKHRSRQPCTRTTPSPKTVLAHQSRTPAPCSRDWHLRTMIRRQYSRDWRRENKIEVKCFRDSPHEMKIGVLYLLG